MTSRNPKIAAYARKIASTRVYNAYRLRVASQIIAAIVAKYPRMTSADVGDAKFDEELTRNARGAVSQADALLKELGYEKP